MNAIVVVMLGALFAIVVLMVLIGANTPDDEPPHPSRCDCMGCGKRAAEHELKEP